MEENKTEIEGEISVSNTDSIASDLKVENSVETPLAKVGDGSEYESAEDDGDKMTDKNVKEVPSKDQESLSELVDEEGGKEGIAEPEDVEGEFLNGDEPDEIDREIEDVETTHGNQGDVHEVDEGDVDDTDVGDVDEADEGEIEEADEGDVDEADEGDIDEGDEAGENSDEYADERQLGDDEGSEDGEYVEEERQQGDGEECSPANAITEKELDFDEDRRNPQYIPKKGIFYEHDDRNNEDIKEKEEEPARDRKKKLWLDEGKWGHDRFRLEEQYPKSKHELIETYGYDIRNEDGPPRARRRRRYGRGPTKYVRNWEDVSAYGREKFRGSPRGTFRGRRASGRFRGAPRFRGRGRKDFISDDSSKKPYSNENEAEHEEPQINENQDIDLIATVPVINNSEFPALPSKDSVNEPEIVVEKRPYFQRSLSEAPENKSVRTLTFENSNLSGRNSLERDVPTLKTKSVVYGRQYDKNISPNDRSVNQTGWSLTQHEKNLSHLEKSINHHEKSVNYHERNINQYERNSNQHDRNLHQFEKNLSTYERNMKQPERSTSFHDKNLSHSLHDRSIRKPIPRGGRGSGRGDYNRRGRGSGMRHISPRFLENKVTNLTTDLEHLTIDDVAEVCNGVNTDKIRQIDNDVVPGISSESEITNISVKGAGDASSRPKRYSSLRQRSLPETTTYQTSQAAVPTQASAYYESEQLSSNEFALQNITNDSDLGFASNSSISGVVEQEPVLVYGNSCSEEQLSSNEFALQNIANYSDLGFASNSSISGVVEQEPVLVYGNSCSEEQLSSNEFVLQNITNYSDLGFASNSSISGVVEQEPVLVYGNSCSEGYQPALYAPTNTGVPTPSTQSQSATSPPIMNPSGFHPYDCGIRLQLLPRAIFPQPTMSAGQSVLAPPPPSPCIPPPPNANLMDFAPPPPPSGYHQYAYQQYAQPPPPPPPTAPSDIYQPGITYYFAQQAQSTSTRPTVQKRPKAAIPILPPPERESKKDENKEGLHTSSSRNSSNDPVNGEVPSLRTDASQQLSSVGVKS